MHDQRPSTEQILNCWEAATIFFKDCFARCDQTIETLWVAHVDTAGHCIHLSEHRGDANGAELSLRHIIGDVIERGSAGILLAHNHPSGDSRPSDSDLQATRKLATTIEALDCKVLDHLIFAGANCVSLRALGFL